MYQPTSFIFSHNILTIAVAQLPPPITAIFVFDCINSMMYDSKVVKFKEPGTIGFDY
jgi:hypothetical protein